MKKEIKPDFYFVFECKKCGHYAHIGKKKSSKTITKLTDYDCPNCGEEGFRNWVYYGETVLLPKKLIDGKK